MRYEIVASFSGYTSRQNADSMTVFGPEGESGRMILGQFSSEGIIHVFNGEKSEYVSFSPEPVRQPSTEEQLRAEVADLRQQVRHLQEMYVSIASSCVR